MTPAFVQTGPHDLPDTLASTGRASCQTAGEPTRSIVGTLELGGRIESLTVQFARHELIEQLGDGSSTDARRVLQPGLRGPGQPPGIDLSRGWHALHSFVWITQM